jgi:hypothetical protein
MRELIKQVAKEFSLDWKALAAFVSVESGGKGFSEDGRLIIQFEPAWFRKLEPYAPSGKWSLNGVERQRQEWEAFNDAWKYSPEVAMQSTSIGLGQIMGFHWKRLGYSSVGAMWDDAKRGIERQLWQLAKFIATDKTLLKYLRDKNWTMVATIFNGSKFREIAKKYGRTSYDISMKLEYEKL